MNATIIETPDRAEPAVIYDRFFVPALFARWGPIVSEAALIARGDRVLDVACGTGALTLAAARRAGSSGSVIGLDPNPQMLALARAKSGGIGWQEGRAEDLPFAKGTFDAVVSQFGMMFFDDPQQAFGEMSRVLAPGGRLAVAVFDAIETAPGYDALARLLDRLFGQRVGDAMRAPFALGDADHLRDLAEAALPGVRVAQHEGSVRFRSLDELIETEHACIWTLGGLIDGAQAALLKREAEQALSRFVKRDGSIEFPMPALIATGSKIA